MSDTVRSLYPPDLFPICDCGQPAQSYCGVGVPGLQLILCRAPVCSTDGRWCAAHRHRNGTMGYPQWHPVDTSYHGYEPDGPGLWEAIKAQLKMWFWSAAKMAQVARDEQMAQFPPPAPLAEMTFRVNGRVFVSRGDKMVEQKPVKPPRIAPLGK